MFSLEAEKKMRAEVLRKASNSVPLAKKRPRADSQTPSMPGPSTSSQVEDLIPGGLQERHLQATAERFPGLFDDVLPESARGTAASKKRQRGRPPNKVEPEEDTCTKAEVEGPPTIVPGSTVDIHGHSVSFFRQASDKHTAQVGHIRSRLATKRWHDGHLHGGHGHIHGQRADRRGHMHLHRRLHLQFFLQLRLPPQQHSRLRVHVDVLCLHTRTHSRLHPHVNVWTIQGPEPAALRLPWEDGSFPHLPRSGSGGSACWGPPRPRPCVVLSMWRWVSSHHSQLSTFTSQTQIRVDRGRKNNSVVFLQA